MSVGEAHAPVVLFIGLVAVDGVPDGTVVVVTEVEGPEYNVPFVEVVIDSGQVLVLGVFAPAEEPQIQKWIIVVGSVLRPDVHQRLADRVNQGLRQYAARNDLPRGGVFQHDRLARVGIHRLTDVARFLPGGRGKRHHELPRRFLPELFHAEKEESFVFLDGSSDGPAELIEQVIRQIALGLGSESGPGIQRFIPMILVQCTVNCVSSGVGDDADDCPARAPVLHRIQVGFDAKLFNGINHGKECDLARLGLQHADAVVDIFADARPAAVDTRQCGVRW